MEPAEEERQKISKVCMVCTDTYMRIRMEDEKWHEYKTVYSVAICFI